MSRLTFLDPVALPDENPEYLQIESCHSKWLFDLHQLRFRRILKGFDGSVTRPMTEWRPYYRLESSPLSESFVVWLNPEGTRLLRSARHQPGCTSCADRDTREIRLPGVRPPMAGR